MKVKAFEGDAESEMATFDYKIDPNFTVAAPTADPAAGTYQESQAVKLSPALHQMPKFIIQQMV